MTPTRFLRAALYRRNLATAMHSGLGGGAPSAVACDISALGLFVLSRSLLSFVDLYSTTLESITPPYDWCAQNIVDLLTQLHPQKINNSARVNIDMDSTTERVPRVRNLPARFVDKKRTPYHYVYPKLDRKQEKNGKYASLKASRCLEQREKEGIQ